MLSAAPARSRATGRVVPLLAILAVTAIALATNVPAVALAAVDPGRASLAASGLPPASAERPQRVHVAADAMVAVPLAEGYTVEAPRPVIRSQLAGLGAVAIGETGAIVWPTAIHDRISSGFGGRSAPCSGCSTYHDGIDFVAGNGNPVGALADGVVVQATEAGGTFGVMVEVQHNIDGQLISTIYGHLQYGSLAVVPGQTVTAGQRLGLVGSTGQSTGPHLHLEMFGADGVRFDGYDWLVGRIGL